MPAIAPSIRLHLTSEPTLDRPIAISHPSGDASCEKVDRWELAQRVPRSTAVCSCYAVKTVVAIVLQDSYATDTERTLSI
jgi:hypothetical protein